MLVLSCSAVSNCLRPPWTVARQAPLSMGFPRQEYWSRLPFPSPGDLPDPGIKPASFASPALTGIFFTTEPYEKVLPVRYTYSLLCPVNTAVSFFKVWYKNID